MDAEGHQQSDRICYSSFKRPAVVLLTPLVVAVTAQHPFPAEVGVQLTWGATTNNTKLMFLYAYYF